MRDALVIFGIAALVAVAFTVAWLVAVLRDGRRLRGMRFHRPDFDLSRACLGVKGDEHVTPAGGKWYSVSFKLKAQDDEAAKQFVTRRIIHAPALVVIDELSLIKEDEPSTRPATADDETKTMPIVTGDVPGVEP